MTRKDTRMVRVPAKLLARVAEITRDLGVSQTAAMAMLLHEALAARKGAGGGSQRRDATKGDS